MNDVLISLDKISEDLAKLSTSIGGIRTKSVSPQAVQSVARGIARIYFESIRPELLVLQTRAGLVEEIDFVLQGILQLATAPREKEAYLGHIAELRPYLLEATIDLMKARGIPRLVLSQMERATVETLTKMLPGSSASYEQVLRDIADGQRISWRGTAGELREVLREVIDHLAPDDKVRASQGFQLEQGQSGPTQRQKVRYILRARRIPSAAVTVAEGTLETVEAMVASLARSTYQLGSVSTHTPSTGVEIRRLKRYVDALLAELLEVA
jgi:hypothetical protein